MRTVILLGLALALLFGCTGGSGSGAGQETGSGTFSGDLPSVVRGDGDAGTVAGSSDNSLFLIPVKDITTEAKFYSLQAGLDKAQFFAVQSSDGEMHVAFDACDVCGGRKGYRQEGSDMVCNNCGRHFRINDIGTKNIGGGCWPSYLSYRLDGENIVLEKNEIARGAFRFR